MIMERRRIISVTRKSKTIVIVLVILSATCIVVYHNYLRTFLQTNKHKYQQKVNQWLLDGLMDGDASKQAVHKNQKPKWKAFAHRVVRRMDSLKGSSNVYQSQQFRSDFERKKTQHVKSLGNSVTQAPPKVISQNYMQNNSELHVQSISKFQVNKGWSDLVGGNTVDTSEKRKQNTVKAQTTTMPTDATITSPGYNVISMSLWGRDPKYTIGALKNANLVKKFFPGWKLRIYMEMPGPSTRYEPVPDYVLEGLKESGAETFFMHVATMPVPPMMWRFLVVDDLSVDHFLIRDADSRLIARDASAVSDWLKSGKPFHCIRDHPSHSTHAISGGLWGGVPKQIQKILQSTFYDLVFGRGSHYIADMELLQQIVWTRVQSQAYCTDSVSCDTWPSSHPFKVARQNYEHCGAVYDEADRIRMGDILILKQLGENKKCIPPSENPSADKTHAIASNGPPYMHNDMDSEHSVWKESKGINIKPIPLSEEDFRTTSGQRGIKIVKSIHEGTPADANFNVNVPGYNVISMSLWGGRPKYNIGALKNAELVKVYFPGWKLRIYMENPGSSTAYEPVPDYVLETLKKRGAEIVFMNANSRAIPTMMWRFLVADDLLVDHFLVRDTDSRLSARDASAVSDWLKSGKPLHCIRDHPSHSSYAISGGLWGGVPKAMQKLLQFKFYDFTYGRPSRYMEDMNFLQHFVWPRMQNEAYCTDSVSCDSWPSAHPFKVVRKGYEHCGGIYDEKENIPLEDVHILKQSGDNKNCVPPFSSIPANKQSSVHGGGDLSGHDFNEHIHPFQSGHSQQRFQSAGRSSWPSQLGEKAFHSNNANQMWRNEKRMVGPIQSGQKEFHSTGVHQLLHDDKRKVGHIQSIGKETWYTGVQQVFKENGRKVGPAPLLTKEFHSAGVQRINEYPFQNGKTALQFAAASNSGHIRSQTSPKYWFSFHNTTPRDIIPGNTGAYQVSEREGRIIRLAPLHAKVFHTARVQRDSEDLTKKYIFQKGRTPSVAASKLDLIRTQISLQDGNSLPNTAPRDVKPGVTPGKRWAVSGSLNISTGKSSTTQIYWSPTKQFEQGNVSRSFLYVQPKSSFKDRKIINPN